MNSRLDFATLRRRALIFASLAALAAVPSAAAGFQPLRRDFGELSVPRLRAGTITIPPAHKGERRIRVIVTLKLPPLAQAYGRGLFATGSARQLNVRSEESQAYLHRIDAAQRFAVAQLHRAIPSAIVTLRYRVVLDGFTVSIPVTKLPQLARQSFTARVWPTYTYHLALNRSPSIIGADAFHAATGANGEGIKIGVVDDGVDNTNPFLSGAGFTAPPGYPIGAPQFTSNKVIVARAFPGPGSGAGGKLPVDRKFSFHATHVAGIAAGDAGTCSPGGNDHPATCGLSGVAPKAYIGNYRVFNVPTPIGHIAESPEIAEAFEQTVIDGMQVVNFSGGGPESEPLNDIMLPVIGNVAAAGVVPVIAAGNDRDDFGFGTAGSPGTAPAAISVAAVSSSQVFAPALSAFNAGGTEVLHAPIITRGSTPAGWATADQIMVDVGSVVGRSGTAVDRYVCAPGSNPNADGTDLPAHSLDGVIALVSRGFCTFASKAQRAKDAGAIGIVLVDNRAGEANGIPIELPVPSGMISDLDGATLRAALAPTGRIRVHIGRAYEDIVTGRSGVVTSFSSGGPEAINHNLKPDIAAPGGQILSSTLPEFSGGSPFAVFDGTSMATPHIAGAAALLVQRHPAWSVQQLKSALMSTAGTAWRDTARTKEAPVTLQGAGLANVLAADDPLVFTEPASLSFGVLNVTRGAASRGLLLRVQDAGGGTGNWTIALTPQSATTGTDLLVPALVAVGPGGEADVSVVARASAAAQPGEEMGFITLTRGTVTRRIPYYFMVAKPALENVAPEELKTFVIGDTIKGTSNVSQYRFPSWPFGPPPSYTGAAMNESGAEHLYSTLLSVPAINFGVSVYAQSANSIIDPWVLGSRDENDVEGIAGTPVNANSLMYDYRADVEAAAVVFPLTKRYYVSVDSGSDPFTGQGYPGQYILRSWIDDLSPPSLRLVTTRIAAGRPMLVAIANDSQSGVDALSIVIAYNKVILGAAAYDPPSGIVLFPIPANAPALKAGKRAAILSASDYQETKNVNTIGQDILPNTAFANVKLNVVAGPAVTWLSPPANVCAVKVDRLIVVASSTKKVKSVTFYDGKKKLKTLTKGTEGLFAQDWKTTGLKKGKHVLRATVRDAAGKTFTASRTVRVCK
jgi:minor extracellular serine protease Vpr